MSWRSLTPTLLALVLILRPGPASASVPNTGDSVRYLIVAEQPWRSVVAAVLSFPTGSSGDQRGQEGSHWLLASLLEEEANLALTGLPAAVTVEAGRSATTVTLLAAPDRWTEGYGALRRVLFQHPLTESGLERARATLRARHRFESGAPIREFQREVPRMIAGGLDPWSRPSEGYEEVLDSIGLEALELIRGRWLQPDSALAAVLGPVTEEAVDSWLAEVVRPSMADPGVTGADPSHPGQPPPWITGDRLEITRDVANSWLAIAFPVDPALPRTHLELLSHAVDERLNPTPPDPGALDVRVGIEEPPGGSVLLVTAALLPDATRSWEEHALEAVESLGAAEMEELLFRTLRRRFRSRALLAESAPELAAARWIGDAVRGAGIRPVEEEIWELTPASLQAAAAALGPPRILLFGPDLSAQSGVYLRRPTLF
jgi:hypothetical protein